MSVSSVGRSSANSIYGNRANHIISGLASGLDTEGLIEGMVQDIKMKMDNKKADKTILGWKQSAYRGISSQLVQISNKYLSYSSSTNLRSMSFFTSGILSTVGKFADKISVSGSTNSDVEILGVKNMAKDTSVSFAGDKFSGVNKTDIVGSEIDLNATTEVSNLAGQYISFKYNNKSYTVDLPKDGDYSNMEKAAATIQKAINAEISGTEADGTPKKEVVKITASGNSFNIAYGKDAVTSANLEFRYGSCMEALGIKEGDTLNGDKSLTTTDVSLTTTKKYSEILSGKSITLNFNGKDININLPEDCSDANKIVESINSQIESKIGKGRVTVSNEAMSGGSLKLKFTVADGDKGNTLVIKDGSTGLLGKNGALGIDDGACNGLNINSSLKDLGVDIGADGEDLVINGVTIGKYNGDTSISKIMDDINRSDAGVKVSYSNTSGRFVFTSTQGGAGGTIKMGEGGDLASKIFGTVDTTSDGPAAEGVNITKGQDAEMAVRINGEEIVLKSSSNTFNIDGLAVSVNGTFNTENFSPEGTFNAEGVEGVTLKKSVDTDKIFDAIKGFVDDYNKLIEDVNGAYTTRPDKKIRPLTDDQKKDMTEKQIEEFEKKAKQGVLYNDSNMRSLASEIRFAFSNPIFQEIGINVSTIPSERGKITIDENKLRAAIESDPEKVGTAFAGKEVKNENGEIVSQAGAMEQLKTVFDRYASTTGATKGILIEKAGSEFSPTSLVKNAMRDEMDDIDEEIEKLTKHLNRKIDFYTSKFSKLEVLVSQMNSQSAYLASLSGG